MAANLHAVNRKPAAHFSMNHFHDFLFERPTANVGLVGRHDKQVTSLLEFCARDGNAGQNFEFTQACRCIRQTVTFQGAVDDAIAVEEDGAPDFGLRTSDFTARFPIWFARLSIWGATRANARSQLETPRYAASRESDSPSAR